MTTLDLVVIAIYFLVMIAIGIWAMRRVKVQEDYFMGGRSFGKWMQTFAAFGAGTGAHEPVTVGRTVWTSGLSGVWSALMWLFVTPLYWITAVWYRRMRHLTLGDWFVERYQSPAMGAAYAFFTIVFYMFYLSTMFSAIAKFAVPLLGAENVSPDTIGLYLIPSIAAVVMIYGVLGGLTAAYLTDLIQGVFIILLSVMLIPYGLLALVEKFGDPQTDGMLSGFAILHEQVSAETFQLFGGPAAGEFPLSYIISLTLLVLVGIVVQPHFITTGGGSAKSEDEARTGLVIGNFLKRLCTVGWAITALIALALLADNVEVAADPDQVWGVAAREILGPLNLGLVGLMLSCLLAAVMSSADTYMLVTSAVVVRNLYQPYVRQDASERHYLLVARLAGGLMIVGAAVIALTYADVFGQFKMAIEIPIIFAAPFWVGMYWRRANAQSAWMTMAFSLTLFFILPYLAPAVMPSLREDARWATKTTAATTLTQEKAIFWRGGLAEQPDGQVRGEGPLNVDLMIYPLLGLDLESVSKGGLEALRLPPRLLTPFLILILLSFVTKPNNSRALERYFAKMNTPVRPDPAEDKAALEQAYAEPGFYRDRLLFPKSMLEFTRPTKTDVTGFGVSVVVCFLIVGLLVWAVQIGA